MITDFQPTAYTLIRDLVIAMHTNATTLLYTKFNLTDAIWEELQEELDHFYGPERQLGIAPMAQALYRAFPDAGTGNLGRGMCALEPRKTQRSNPPPETALL